MSQSKTVATKTTAVNGKGTLVQITITQKPTALMGKVSLHDCATPDQAAAHNEIWPRGAGSTVTFTKGLTVHAGDNTGQVTVVTA